MLGARIVRAWADRKLASAAEGALQKIEAVLPARLKLQLSESALMAPGFHITAQVRSGLEDLRRAIRERRKARFHYVDKARAGSERVVHPSDERFESVPGQTLADFLALVEAEHRERKNLQVRPGKPR